MNATLKCKGTQTDSRIGEGNGNPLQCSCLENSVDRGAWWSVVQRIDKVWTRLKRLSMHLRAQHYVNLFCGSSMRLHLELCWVGVSLPQWGKVTCEGKIESRDSNSSYFLCHLVPTALLSPQGSSLFTSEAALLRMGLCPSDGSSFW